MFCCDKNYFVYRADRCNQPGGGVLIAAADCLTSSMVITNSVLEIICVSIHLNNQNALFCACYRPPNATSDFCDKIHDVLNNLVLKFPHAPLFLLGDFNFPKINWSVPCSAYSNLSGDSTTFFNMCLDFNLTQLVDKPTRVGPTSANILDLVLRNVPDLVRLLIFLPGLSAHCFIHFTLEAEVSRRLTHSKAIRNYAEGDYASINTELECFIDAYMVGFFDRTVEHSWHLFKEKVTFLTNKYIPLVVISGKQRSPWFTSDLKRLQNLKKRSFRVAKRKNETSRWFAYKNISDAYRAAIKKAKDVFFTNTLPSLLQSNPKMFWKTIRPNKKELISLRYADNQVMRSDECCRVLNQVFAKSFSNCPADVVPQLCDYNFFPMDPIVVDPVGIMKLIHDLKPSSCGVDEINPKLLKNTEVYSSLILPHIFFQSLQ